MNRTKRSKIGFVLCAVLSGVLTGCVGYVEEPRPARVYASPPPVYVQDDYVYYPGYQVYYSSNRRQYIYRDGRSWVTRPAPPRVSVEVLSASPSVRLDFHDSPAIHHATVVRKYPKQWTPPGWSPNRGEGNRDDGKGNDRGGRR
jgi:hypothetical protein